MFLNKLKNSIKDLFRYPDLKRFDETYEIYWQSRDTKTAVLNSFQQKRADLLLKYLKEGDSVLDVGCGDGKILTYLKSKISLGEILGIDFSDTVLKKARERGIKVIQKDLRNLSGLNDIPNFDFIILFEFLEHFPNSEEFLEWALKHSRKGVVFSVPNTGYIVHRLRLLFGRFPLQWKTTPSEHVRFWTVNDIKWWFRQLGIKSYKIHLYEGFPLLNKIWSTLFGQGIFVFIPIG